MNIVFLCHYFPPEVNAPASRTYEHCREWVKQGHQVTVITSFPNHPYGKIYPGYKRSLSSKESIDGIQVLRVWTWLAANEGFSSRIINYISYMIMAIVLCGRTAKADVVVSTSPQFFCGLAGFFVSRLKRAKWILEIRDLWPESIVAVGAMRQGIVVKSLYWLEKFCYNRADRIVAVTDAFKRYMIGKGIAADKIHIIKNGVCLERYTRDTSPEAQALLRNFIDEYDLDNKFVAAYVGTHGMAHHLETLVQSAELTRDREDIVYLLVGEGAEREALITLRNSLDLHKTVKLTGQLPKEVMPIVWQAADVAITHLRKSPTFESVIPSKIFESMAMSKPLLHGVSGESAELVHASGGGVCFTSESQQELAQLLVELADDPQRCIELGANGQKFVSEHFNRETLAKRFLTHIKELCQDVFPAKGER